MNVRDERKGLYTRMNSREMAMPQCLTTLHINALNWFCVVRWLMLHREVDRSIGLAYNQYQLFLSHRHLALKQISVAAKIAVAQELLAIPVCRETVDMNSARNNKTFI